MILVIGDKLIENYIREKTKLSFYDKDEITEKSKLEVFYINSPKWKLIKRLAQYNKEKGTKTIMLMINTVLKEYKGDKEYFDKLCLSKTDKIKLHLINGKLDRTKIKKIILDVAS